MEEKFPVTPSYCYLVFSEILPLKYWVSNCIKYHGGIKYCGNQSHHLTANRWGNNGNSEKFYFLGLQNHCGWWLQSWNLKMIAPWKKSYDQPILHSKKQRHYFADKGLSSQSYGFSSSHVWMWELDHKEGWALKNWCFWIVVLEKTLESPLGLQGAQTSQF